MSSAQEVAHEVAEYRYGIRHNFMQFSHQLVQVLFVGFTIGMFRTVVPALAESEFGVAKGSFMMLMAFVAAFGFVKGTLNFVAGRMSERIGRKKPIVWGMWLCGAGVALVVLGEGELWWSFAAAVMGFGMALLYPTLSAAVSDIAHPNWTGAAQPSASTASGATSATALARCCWARWQHSPAALRRGSGSPRLRCSSLARLSGWPARRPTRA
jgi:MFS family permease